MAMAEVSTDVAHQAHEGYHFYSIPFHVNLANNEQTQIKFITQNDIQVKRKYTAQMNHPNHFSDEVKKDVTQFISIESLEFPLPRGIVRTYSKTLGTNVLLGETFINHTPQHTALSLELGTNFDLKVTQTLLSRDRGSWSHDNDVRYTIKNASDEEKTLQILVPFSNNDGDRVKTKMKYTLSQGNMITFMVKVQAQSTKSFDVYFSNKVQK